MKLNLLVSAAVAVCLAWPATVLADPPAGNDQGGSQQADHGKGGQKGHGKAATGGPGGQGSGGQGSGGQGSGGQGSGGQGQGAAAGGQTQVGSQVGSGGGQGGQPQVHVRSVRTPVVTQGGSSGGQGGQPQVHARRTVTTGGQTAITGFQTQQGGGVTTYRRVRQPTLHPPANLPVLSGWNRGVSGPERDQAGQQWRQQHGGWDSNALWRRNSNWWRGNSAFRLWGGARLGFFFIPEIGYVSVPAEYRVHYWRAGDRLPSWFWRFVVRDYWTYGLPEPPDGCAWVWVDNDVALIDLDDGYILDIEHNVW